MEKGASEAAVVRILVVEDQAMVRAGLCSLLAEQADFKVVGSVGTGREALQLTKMLCPAVVVADYFLNGGVEGAELISLIRSESGRKVEVLTLSMHDEVSVGERAIQAGARGFMTKEESPLFLIDAVRRVAAGRYYVSETLLARMNDHFSGFAPKATGLPGLSEREIQVFRMLGSGLNLSEIGQRLGISPRTVGTHRETLKRKLNIATCDKLAEEAREWLSAAGSFAHE